jgi:hypothetical protein
MSTSVPQPKAKVLGQVVTITKENGTMAYVATIRADDNHDYIIVAAGNYQGGVCMQHAAGCAECAQYRDTQPR